MCWIVFVILWIVCGVITAGVNNAYFRGQYSYIRKDDKEGWFNLCNAIGFGTLGPILLFPTLMQSGFCYYGWNLRWRAEKDG